MGLAFSRMLYGMVGKQHPKNRPAIIINNTRKNRSSSVTSANSTFVESNSNNATAPLKRDPSITTAYLRPAETASMQKTKAKTKASTLQRMKRKLRSVLENGEPEMENVVVPEMSYSQCKTTYDTNGSRPNDRKLIECMIKVADMEERKCAPTDTTCATWQKDKAKAQTFLEGLTGSRRAALIGIRTSQKKVAKNKAEKEGNMTRAEADELAKMRVYGITNSRRRVLEQKHKFSKSPPSMKSMMNKYRKQKEKAEREGSRKIYRPSPPLTDDENNEDEEKESPPPRKHNAPNAPAVSHNTLMKNEAAKREESRRKNIENAKRQRNANTYRKINELRANAVRKEANKEGAKMRNNIVRKAKAKAQRAEQRETQTRQKVQRRIARNKVVASQRKKRDNKVAQAMANAAKLNEKNRIKMKISRTKSAKKAAEINMKERADARTRTLATQKAQKEADKHSNKLQAERNKLEDLEEERKQLVSANKNTREINNSIRAQKREVQKQKEKFWVANDKVGSPNNEEAVAAQKKAANLAFVRVGGKRNCCQATTKTTKTRCRNTTKTKYCHLHTRTRKTPIKRRTSSKK